MNGLSSICLWMIKCYQVFNVFEIFEMLDERKVIIKSSIVFKI